MIIFTKRSCEIVFANNAARRLLHPAPLRRGKQLPEPWPSFSLRDYAQRLIVPGVAADELVHLDRERAYIVSGITARETGSGVILIEDVSERERRSRAEREFVANAAHELLTPLTGIVSAAHVLEAGAKQVAEDRDHFIAHIARECDRLTRIARTLLVLARAQSGEEPPRLEILPLCGLLDEVVEFVAPASRAKITVRCDDKTTVLADADLFLQAAHNLVANAIRHGSGDEIILDVDEVGGGLVQIDIRDARGRQDVDELRARFRSAAGRDGGGFGLGLSIAAQSLEAIGGRLLLNAGATRIELPSGAVAA